MGLFLVVPIAISGLYSFARRGTYGGVLFEYQWGNYLRAFDPLYLRVLWNSVELSVLTTVSCFLLGYPLAYWCATASLRLRPWILLGVVIPFWTNFVVRAYAIKVLLGMLPESWSLLNSPFAVWLGMVTNYLPFMVLPIFVALEKFDFSLIEAARDLGAPPRKVIIRILLPLTLAGSVTGAIFVFTPALGEFVIPDLLGGARTILMGNLITDQFLKTRDWPFGSSLAVLLILTVVGSLVLYLRQGSGSRDFRMASLGSRPAAPRGVAVVGSFALLLLHVPLGVLVIQSFMTPEGWGMEWYRRAFNNPQILSALKNSLITGTATLILAGGLGTSAAFAIVRGYFPGRKLFQAAVTVPLIMPEIVLGLSLLIWFVRLGVELGLVTVIIAHVTFSVSYVILTVQSRLEDFDVALEEAAADLGAGRWQVFRRVTLPLIWPAVYSGSLMAFTLSFDDFLITFFNSGVGSDTLPLKIYSMVKFGVSREINAVSALLLVLTVLVATTLRRASPGSRDRTGP